MGKLPRSFVPGMYAAFDRSPIICMRLAALNARMESGNSVYLEVIEALGSNEPMNIYNRP